MYSKDKLVHLTKNMDEDQKMVLDKAVHFAIKIKKYRKNKNSPVAPPPLVVQGGAGFGKSTVYNTVSQHVEMMLREAGDDPDHPYILKLAYIQVQRQQIFKDKLYIMHYPLIFGIIL